MIYEVKKLVDSDESELLPDITDTIIWCDYDEGFCSKSVSAVALLYEAISKRENYYQLNTPTAYGNPQYSNYCGIVTGLLKAYEMEEIEIDNKIIISKKNRKKLVIDKIKRSQTYIDCVKDINNTMRNLFG